MRKIEKKNVANFHTTLARKVPSALLPAKYDDEKEKEEEEK